jgi:hypothetical protein
VSGGEEGPRINQSSGALVETQSRTAQVLSHSPIALPPICNCTKITFLLCSVLHSPSLISIACRSICAGSDSRQFLSPSARLLQVDAVTHTLGVARNSMATSTSEALCGLQAQGRSARRCSLGRRRSEQRPAADPLRGVAGELGLSWGAPSTRTALTVNITLIMCGGMCMDGNAMCAARAFRSEHIQRGCCERQTTPHFCRQSDM